jgi:hypothetical protein
LICSFHILFLHFEFAFSHVSLLFADANAVLSLTSIVSPNLSLCVLQSGMIYHLALVISSFCT